MVLIGEYRNIVDKHCMIFRGQLRPGTLQKINVSNENCNYVSAAFPELRLIKARRIISNCSKYCVTNYITVTALPNY